METSDSRKQIVPNPLILVDVLMETLQYIRLQTVLLIGCLERSAVTFHFHRPSTCKACSLFHTT